MPIGGKHRVSRSTKGHAGRLESSTKDKKRKGHDLSIWPRKQFY